jgi:hypothetical protein
MYAGENDVDSIARDEPATKRIRLWDADKEMKPELSSAPPTSSSMQVDSSSN